MNSKISMYGNKRMLFGVLVLAFLIFLLWYFYHPLSPHNKRTQYVATFSEVGPLASGNNVKIGGLPKGRILELHKTDSCIYVSFEVISSIRLPKDSRFTFATAGFLGNREIQINIGTSKDYYTSRDTIFQTFFDKGLNTARADLDKALDEFHSVVEILTAALDSIDHSATRKQADRVAQKGKKLAATADRDLQGLKDNVENLLSNISASATKLENTLEKTKSDLNSVKDGGKQLISQLEALKSSADNTQNLLKSALSKIDQNDNSFALILQKNGEVSVHLERISSDAEALISDIKKNGIKLNIDIF